MWDREGTMPEPESRTDNCEQNVNIRINESLALQVSP